MRFVIASFRLLLLALVTLTVFVVGSIIYIFYFGSYWSSVLALKTWGRGCMFCLNVKTNMTGIPQNRTVIIMPNHRGYIDVFLVLTYAPASIVAKNELAKWPIIGIATKLGRMIMVDRKKMSSKIETMRKIGKEIQKGGAVILFPEGKTYEGPLTGVFQAGSFRIAAQTHTPIVPVAINYKNSKDAWVGNKLFLVHFYEQMGKWKTEANLWFGEPILDENHLICMQKTKEAIDNKLKEWNLPKC
jgi:1-acyl-sn-glycerol-3-phosphate acyltransferase